MIVVIILLNRAAISPGAGFYTGGPKSGSPNADYGTYVSGAANDRTLQCVMRRTHPIYFSYDGSYANADYTIAAMWVMNGAGGV